MKQTKKYLTNTFKKMTLDNERKIVSLGFEGPVVNKFWEKYNALKPNDDLFTTRIFYDYIEEKIVEIEISLKRKLILDLLVFMSDEEKNELTRDLKKHLIFKIKTCNISYDVEDKEDLKVLPKNIEFLVDGKEIVDNEIDEVLADKISDKTGFCINNFNFQIVDIKEKRCPMEKNCNQLLNETIENLCENTLFKIKGLNEPLYDYLISEEFDNDYFDITEGDYEVFGFDLKNFQLNYKENDYDYNLSIYDLINTNDLIHNLIIKENDSAYIKMAQVNNFVKLMKDNLELSENESYDYNFKGLIIDSYERTLEEYDVKMLVFEYLYCLELLRKE